MESICSKCQQYLVGKINKDFYCVRDRMYCYNCINPLKSSASKNFITRSISTLSSKHNSFSSETNIQSKPSQQDLNANNNMETENSSIQIEKKEIIVDTDFNPVPLPPAITKNHNKKIKSPTPIPISRKYSKSLILNSKSFISDVKNKISQDDDSIKKKSLWGFLTRSHA